MIPSRVYDKAKYHFNSVAGYGLPKDRAYNHTLFFFRWLIENDLVSEMFKTQGADALGKFKQGHHPLQALYEWWDCCLVSEMLTESGNGFAISYFDLEKGSYLKDYLSVLQDGLQSEFHIQYNEENYLRFQPTLNRRYQEWANKISRRWWQFWKKAPLPQRLK